MLIIEDRVFVEIKVDGKELDGPNLVSTILLCEGTPVVAPSCVMLLNDHSGLLSKELCLTDGNQILITVGTKPDDLATVSRQYRVFSVTRVAAQNGPTLKLTALYDAPKFTLEAARESFSGTSDQVMSAVAERCQLDYDGPTEFNGRAMADSQVWMNVAASRGAFLQHMVARHAFMDTNSAMACALTSLGVLKYRNMMDVIATPYDKVKYVFSHNVLDGEHGSDGVTTYAVHQSKERSHAGMMNAKYNYGSTLITDGISGATSIEDKVDVKTSSPYLAINGQVADTVGKTSVTYGPLDCGNVHENYSRAGYQNVRQLGLFTEVQSVLVSDPTDVQLFDVAIYKQADQDPKRPVRNSDIYVVVGKTVFIANGRTYGERIELARMSITEKGEADLKASEPANARASSTPEVTLNPTANVAATMLEKSRGIMGVVRGVEQKIGQARAAGQRALQSVKATLPTSTLFGINLQSYVDNPRKAAQDVRSAIESAKQMKRDAEQFKDRLSDTAQAIRDGNYAMAALGVSNIAQSAAMFRPEGVAGNFASMLGITSAMGAVATTYKTIQEGLAPVRDLMGQIEGAQQDFDNLRSDMNGYVRDYEAIVGEMASTYNYLIESVTGQSPNLSVPNIEINRRSFMDMVESAAAPTISDLDIAIKQVQSVASIQSQIANTIQTTDDTRQLGWVPTEGFSTLAVTPEELLAQVAQAGNKAANSEKQVLSFADLIGDQE